MDTNVTKERIAELVVEFAPNPEIEAEADALLVEDFGYHSIVMIELSIALEREFQLQPLPPVEARAIVSLSDLQDAIIRQLERQSGA